MTKVNIKELEFSSDAKYFTSFYVGLENEIADFI